MSGKAITYKTTNKCLGDNRTAKYEASVRPAKNMFLFVIETPMLNVNVKILLVGMSTCKTCNIKTEIYY
jgi:hypothetical protein